MAAEAAANAAKSVGNAGMSFLRGAWNVATSSKTWAVVGLSTILLIAAAPATTGAAIAAIAPTGTGAAGAGAVAAKTTMTDVLGNGAAVVKSAFNGGANLLQASGSALQTGATGMGDAAQKIGEMMSGMSGPKV
ncbi:MAG: hypothetical protein WBK55_04430 [Alphaproteobacteria bacterium]